MIEPEPTPEEIMRREERGFVAALRFMTGQAEARWPTFHDMFEIHRLIFREAYLDALAAADEEVTIDDLKHPDFYPRQTAALQALVDFIVEALLVLSEPDDPSLADGEETDA